jgi:hypothetical protein
MSKLLIISDIGVVEKMLFIAQAFYSYFMTCIPKFDKVVFPLSSLHFFLLAYCGAFTGDSGVG